MRGSPVSLDRSSAFGEEAVISEAFAALTAGDGQEPADVRTYVGDELVLTVTERRLGRPAHQDGRSRRQSAVRPRDAGALQRQRTVEEITGRRVTATLRGQLNEPDVTFELFVLAADGADT